MLDLDADFLNFGDVKLFFPKGDSLYNSYDKSMRGFSPQDYYRELTQNGYRFPISQAELRTTQDTRYALFAYAQALAEDGVAMDVLDVGAFAGLVGIRLANFARCFGYDIAVKLFDPSTAGRIIPYNIEINQLQAPQAEHIDRAISLTGGPLLFTTTAGYLDGGHVAVTGGGHATEAARPSTGNRFLRKLSKLPRLLLNPGALRKSIAWRFRDRSAPEVHSYIVRSLTFADYFASNPQGRLRHQLIKIDTQGFDPFLVRQLLDLDLPGGFSGVIEIVPCEYQVLGIDTVEFLSQLVQKFGLFELYHFPQPKKLRPVESADIASFVAEVAAYPHEHTDLLIVPRNLPNYEAIATRLAQFKPMPFTESLVLD